MALPLIAETPDFRNRRVTVMGLGLFGGGAGVSRFLARQGAKVVVTDLRSPKELRESLAALEGWPVEFRLGRHEERDFREADLVIVNPAVPPGSPYLRMARALETEMNLFFKLCRSRASVGITGSNGKTTTTTLIGEILRRGPRRAWVGGNIGGSLLESLDEIAPGDILVLELSSFQLENLGTIRRSPRTSAVLNLTPNHLDRHGTMENYVAAKRNIVAHQGKGDTKVLNADDPLVMGFANASPSQNLFFSAREDAPQGARIEGERITLCSAGERWVVDVSRRKIPGTFNLQNMAAATAAAFAAAGDGWRGWRDTCEDVFNTFPGVEHRLEFVCERGGVKYYNDSKSTDAEAAMAALEALPGPFVLILGGFDKKIPFDTLAAAVSAKPVRTCVLLGQTAATIEAALHAQPRVPEIVRVKSLEEAVQVPAHPGETVLFSPACASWDMFRNFTERGRLFKELVSIPPRG